MNRSLNFNDRSAKPLLIGIINYPNSSMSAVYGLQEFFRFVNVHIQLDIELITVIDDLNLIELKRERYFDYVFIVPSNRPLENELQDAYYLRPTSNLLNWLNIQYKHGAVMCAACAGVFILAAAINSRQFPLTTHQRLEKQFRAKFPEHKLDTSSLLIEHQSIITVSGVFSWFDLAFTVVKTRLDINVLNEIKEAFLIDSISLSNSTIYDHLTLESTKIIPLEVQSKIRQVQQFLHAQKGNILDIDNIAKQFYMSKRTLQRQFLELTGMPLKEYANHLRVKAMCELLEKTELPFNTIALELGFVDISYASKLFKKVVGMTSKNYRNQHKNLR